MTVLIFRAVARGARLLLLCLLLAMLSLVVLRSVWVLPLTILTLRAPANLITAFYDAAAALDEKGVSSDGRVAVLNPRQYYELIQAVGSMVW